MPLFNFCIVNLWKHVKKYLEAKFILVRKQYSLPQLINETTLLYFPVQRKTTLVLAHQSRRLTRWAYSIASGWRLWSSTLSNNYISKTSWPILVTFYQKHLWGLGGGGGCIRFWGRSDHLIGSLSNLVSPCKLIHFWSNHHQSCR